SRRGAEFKKGGHIVVYSPGLPESVKVLVHEMTRVREAQPSRKRLAVTDIRRKAAHRAICVKAQRRLNPAQETVVLAEDGEIAGLDQAGGREAPQGWPCSRG